MVHAYQKKIEIGHQAKFWAKNKCFQQILFLAHDFTQHWTSGVLILIHSAEACISVMVCLQYFYSGGCLAMLFWLFKLSLLHGRHIWLETYSQCSNMYVFLINLITVIFPTNIYFYFNIIYVILSDAF